MLLDAHITTDVASRQHVSFALLIIDFIVILHVRVLLKINQSINHVRSANRRQLMAPQHRRTKFGRPAFSLRRGQMSWNLLRDHLRDLTLT